MDSTVRIAVRRLAAAYAVALLLLPACYGGVSGVASDGPSEEASDAAKGDDGATDGEGSTGDDSVCIETNCENTGGSSEASTMGDEGPMDILEAPTPVRVRRLTHIEYNNTIADLLAARSEDIIDPAKNFTADIAQDGFTNNAATLTVSPALVEQYMIAAEELSRVATGGIS